MKVIKKTRTGRDETAGFSVYDYMAKSPAEFVNEVLKENPKEWGEIRIDTDAILPFKKCIEYKYGKLIDDVPDQWKGYTIKEINAIGGWSCMDYFIKIR